MQLKFEVEFLFTVNNRFLM